MSNVSSNQMQIPVTIVSGFLGSGKTTLISYVLQELGERKVAVIENEFSEAGIDGDLLANADGQIVEINNGCICCTVGSDLVRRAVRSPRLHQELHVAVPADVLLGRASHDPADGQLVEGFIDLCFEDGDGLVVVDYKTDAIPAAAVGARTAYYAPQLAAYERAIAEATGATGSAKPLFLHPDGAAVEGRSS